MNSRCRRIINNFDEVLTYKDFKNIAKTDPSYASLLHAEYSYCSSHVKDIKNKAFAVYRIGCNKKHQSILNSDALLLYLVA